MVLEQFCVCCSFPFARYVCCCEYCDELTTTGIKENLSVTKRKINKKNPTQCTRIHHVRDNNSGNHNEIMKKDNILYINSIQWSVRLRIFAELNTLSVAAGDAGIQLLKSSGRDKIKSERQKLIIIEKKTMKHAKKYIRMCVCVYQTNDSSICRPTRVFSFFTTYI